MAFPVLVSKIIAASLLRSLQAHMKLVNMEGMFNIVLRKAPDGTIKFGILNFVTKASNESNNFFMTSFIHRNNVLSLV